MTTWMKLLEAKAFWGVDELQARLVAAVDERDAARKLYDERQDDWIAERESLQALNMQLVKNHDAMQAERDAARGEAADRTTMAARAQEALRHVMNGLPCDDSVWAAYGNADSARVWLAKRDEQHQAALLTAQSGEARAVEALRRCHEGAARQLAEPRDHDNDQYALTAIATDCEAVLAAQRSALAWLSLQRRLATAEALEEFADDAGGIEELITCNISDLRSALRARAAALWAGEVPNE